MSKGLGDLKELKARINTAIIQLGNELSTWVNCSSNISDEFKTTIKNDYKRRLTALSNAINELGKKELKALKVIKNYIHVNKPFGYACYIYLNDESEMIPEKEYNSLKEVGL